MSVRSLQRKLAEQGQTFRHLLAETRRELALEYIRHDDIPVLEIGFRLGFTELANFSRAFKQWTGQSPLHYRQQQSYRQ
jgi:AraC-like DNA-binding protein